MLLTKHKNKQLLVNALYNESGFRKLFLCEKKLEPHYYER